MREIVFQSENSLLQLRTLLESAPIDGYTTGDVLRAARVIGSLPESGSVRLEDADYEWVKNRVEGTRWTSAAASIVEFINDVRNAKVV